MSAIKQADFEKITDSPKDVSYFENSIKQAILDYYFTEYGIESTEDISKANQNSWIAACDYARRTCINRVDLIEVVPHSIHPSRGGTACVEQYKIELVGAICDIYTRLCFMYDKVPSLYGFHILTGITKQTLMDWRHEYGGRKVSPSCIPYPPKRVLENIEDARGQSLRNLAISGGRAAIGSIACLNNEIWKNTGFEQIEEKKKVMSVDDLPYFNETTGEWEKNGVVIPVREENIESIDLPILG